MHRYPLFDLITPEEDQTYENRFNIELLVERLYAATRWAVGDFKTKHLPLRYFGASTGAAAALINAAELTSKFTPSSRVAAGRILP